MIFYRETLLHLLDTPTMFCAMCAPMIVMSVLLTESLPQSCIALLMIMTEMSCQRTERSANSSQGLLGLRPLISACSWRISSSSLLWTSQPRRRLRADQRWKQTTLQPVRVPYIRIRVRIRITSLREMIWLQTPDRKMETSNIMCMKFRELVRGR